jgi:HECT-domain (ubiquitin-transferase)/SPRY domain/UBA/TS-N domain
MGSTLFARPGASGGGSNNYSKVDGAGDKNGGVTSAEASQEHVVLQLLVACFLRLLGKRQEAIDDLRKTIAREHKAAQGASGTLSLDTHDEPRDDDDDRSRVASSPVVRDEQDDPALTLALNYVEDDVPLSFESLENKGMRRKAAAAAHDAAARIKSLRKMTEAAKERVKLYSHCTMLALRSLKNFMQTIVLTWLYDGQSLSVKEMGLCPLVRSKLAMAFETLSSVPAQSSFLAMVGGEELDLQRVFYSVPLYKASIFTWVECVPLLYPTTRDQVRVLRSLVEKSTVNDGSDLSSQSSLESVSAFPSMEHVHQAHKLQVLCQRLRVCDLLDDMVSGPIPYLPSDDDDGAESPRSIIHSKLAEGPHLAGSLAIMMGRSLENMIGAAQAEVQGFYLALCHRIHTRVILMDGLYAITETNPDKGSTPVAAVNKKTGSTDLISVSANPSSDLQFDATKCSDSIAILSGLNDSASGGNASSVHQRASKVWGTVLSTHHFSPKTGVHRWAVRLDKCERGHVFVGVATAQASMRTYVGGDKYGWGMIGTQALWHDRRKIRGDYGATFRTGSIIIVTLDTDAGTLSLGSWQDSQSSSAIAADPLVQNLLSPRRQGQVGGTLEDWGVAFEGLPLDSRLFPAVGLYQRDDRVTLLPVESDAVGLGGSIETLGGACFFPRTFSAQESEASELKQIRKYNDLLAWDGVQYAADTLHLLGDCLERGEEEVLSSLLPCLASAISLFPPSVPILSVRGALTLVPHTKRCLSKLRKFRSKQKQKHHMFENGLKDGEWVIRASSGQGDLEEYIVGFESVRDDSKTSVGFEGSGVGTTGKSKNGLVAIYGTMKGSLLSFIEEWSDERTDSFNSSTRDDSSACVVSARASLDGSRFEGTYRNVEFGTSGKIVGIRQEKPMKLGRLRLKHAPQASMEPATSISSVALIGEATLRLAHIHLSTIVANDVAKDIAGSAGHRDDALEMERIGHLQDVLCMPLLSCASHCLDEKAFTHHLDALKMTYTPPVTHKEIAGLPFDFMARGLSLDSFGQLDGKLHDTCSLRELATKGDETLASLSGGQGSLRALCPAEYLSTRMSIATAMIHHCGLGNKLSSLSDSLDKDDAIVVVWRRALRLMEDGTRRAITAGNKKEQCVKLYLLYDAISSFLLELEIHIDRSVSYEVVLEEIAQLYSSIQSESELEYMRAQIHGTTVSGIMRTLVLKDIASLLSDDATDNSATTECIVAGLPIILGPVRVENVEYVNTTGNETSLHPSAARPGSRSRLRETLEKSVSDVFHSLLKILSNALAARATAKSKEDLAMVDSLTLSMLTVFVGCFRGEDVEVAVAILANLKEAFSIHRPELLTIRPEGSRSAGVQTLATVARRDVSRAVLRFAIATVHVVLYQAVRREPRGDDEVMKISDCLSWFCVELGVAIPYLERYFLREISDSVKTTGDEEWDRWCSTRKVGSQPQKKAAPGRSGLQSGTTYFWDYGTIPFMNSSQASKQSLRQKTSGSRSSAESTSKLKAGFAHRHLSQWLHTLCTVLRSTASPSLLVLAKDQNWVTVLLRAIGLLDERDDDGMIERVTVRSRASGVLPARHRARLILFLYHLLIRLDPCAPLIEGLFCIAGVEVVAGTIDDEEHLVSREAVSLLRKLHNPCCPQWRESINRIIPDIATGKSFTKRAGLRSFLNGGIATIRRLSHVLLKPAAAVPLSQDNQSSTPSSKSLTSASQTPAPVGTDAVVAGLMRFEADGGIVSSIDTKSGVCEVLLMIRDASRSRYSFIERTDHLPITGRQTLTVRALRTPLSDVVHAQEVPLFIGGSFPACSFILPILKAATESLISATSPATTAKTEEKLLLDEEGKQPEEVLSTAIQEDTTQRCEDTEALVATSAIEHGATMADTSIAIQCDKVVAKAEEESEQEMSDTQNVSSGILGLALDLMTVQSCIVLLSDPQVLSEFLKDDAALKMIPKLLQLAWPERHGSSDGDNDVVRAARSMPISSLCMHGAKFGHLMTLLREVGFRAHAVSQAPEETWRTRLEGYKSKRQQAEQAPPPSTSPLAPPTSTATSRTRTSGSNEGNTESQSHQSISQSTGGSNSEDEEEQGEAAATAAQHLREAAIAQMAELGIPRSYSELALRRIGGANIEAAVHFCLENGTEIERMLAEEMGRQAAGRGSASQNRDGRDDGHLLRQLLEMGFPRRWCTEALVATGNNVDEALTWILNNNETLENMDTEEDDEEDGGGEVDDEEDEDESEEDESEEGDGSPGAEALQESQENDIKPAASELKPDKEEVGWTASVTPLRVISGRATIDSKTLEVSGQPNGGFASVGVKGVLLKSGKWYYEVILGTAGCIQLGFGDASFAGHCNADRGDGCGDSSSSFSFDGWRRLRWHATATEWGCRWKEGDVIGCFVDLDSRVMSFTLNGQAEDIGMGVAFTGFNYCGGLYPVVSFNRRERLRFILGGSGEAFKYPPPSYRGVGEALIESVKERANLLQKESLLRSPEGTEGEPKKFLCDYSDEDHGHELFSWSHRYYGSDASVHLGSGRSKHSSSKSSQSGSVDSTPAGQLSRRLDKAWSSELKSASPSDESSPEDCMKEGYDTVHKEIAYELFNESIALGVLLARKLMLHIIVTCEEFDPSIFVGGKDSEFEDMQRLWGVIEACANLRSWSGEAGAMAIAAEALGLGIQIQSRSSLERLGLASDEGGSTQRTGYSQLLSTVIQQAPVAGFRDTSRFMAAAAEAAFAGDSGAALIFLQESLQQAVVKSPSFRQVLVVAIRRYVRLLAVVEDSDPRALAEDEGEGERATPEGPKGEEKHLYYAFLSQPDARLAAYFTGILMSTPVQRAVENAAEIRSELFQAWSLGLLSASLPWRMVCAFTTSAILSQDPGILSSTLRESPTLARYYGRLPSTVARRVWAERAAFPVCSRYIQSMLELLSVVKRCAAAEDADLPFEFTRYWRDFEVEASSPRPLLHTDTESIHDWESHGGWVSCEEIWSGVIVYEELNWKKPPRSAVRTLMDGGEGPPMLRDGCTVMRGPDWDSSNNEDGFDSYEAAKEKREQEMKEKTDEPPKTEEEATAEPSEPDPADSKDEKPDTSGSAKKKKKKKVPHPKLPVGTVLSVEPWNGLPALGRKIRWTLTGKEGIYRYGGDGGRHDISHVETNEKGTRVVKKFPFPETAEQCAARRGFGAKKSYSVLLRLRRNPDRNVGDMVNGILEMPDFGSAIKVRCTFEEDGSIILEEDDLLFGSKDSGWEARFGQPTYVPGSRYVLKPGKPQQDRSFNSFYEELSGTNTFDVQSVRNPADGGELKVTSEMRLLRGQRLRDGSFPSIPPPPPPLAFDRTLHAPNLAISRDGRTVTCVASDGRGSAFATTGFSKGSHYLEFKIEQGDSGSVFIGVAEKPPPDTPRLNRWHGWGFVNFRATYSAGSERVYGVHAHAGDTIGMLLDCDAGRLSFFYDGLKYGEHILNDLGCAFENLSPFGFSVEGCGTGGPGQASPNGFPRSPTQGFVRPRTLFPVIGLRNHGDRVSFLPSWTTTYGVDGVTIVKNALSVDELLQKFASDEPLPGWFLNEAFFEYQRWSKGSWAQTETRGSRPYRVDLDTSEIGCAAASSALGMKYALLPGDRIRLKRSAGRILQLAEEAVILGQHQQRIIYKIVAQENEGQSLSEGADLPHCFEECDVVDDIEFLSEPKGHGIPLPTLDRFRCMSSCGLKIVYSGGAVMRSDLEINDMSNTLGTIPSGTVIAQSDVIERRVNSCGVVRFLVKFKDLEGYISANIRGGSEESIVEEIPSEGPENDDERGTSFPTPLDCARKWIEEWRAAGNSENHDEAVMIDNFEEFEKLLGEASVPGLSKVEFDNLLSSAVSVISNFSQSGDALGCNFQDIASALSFALGKGDGALHHSSSQQANAAMNQAAAAVFAKLPSDATLLPSLASVLARVAVIRAVNRRARYALPWLPVRPYQEGSAILGGLCGHGASIDKAGRSRTLCRGEGKWTQPPSIAQRVRSSRGLFFSSVKREFLEGITHATTTPTPLSHDEYELPREIRTVRINRMRAARAMVSDDATAKRKFSVFSQLQNETKNWGGAALRRAYVAKGHAGQRRAFRVKFVGEGVNDYSGPYREVFTDAVIEILTTDEKGNGVLGVLDATPNKAAEIGENRDLHMFSLNGQDLTKLDMIRTIDDVDERELWIRESFSSLLAPRDEASREVEEALVFLGRITGTAYRHGIPIDLPLPLGAVWRAIVENLDTKSNASDDALREIDLLAAKSNPSSPLLWWQQRMLNSFVEGLGNVMPVEILPLLSAEELRDTICGNPEIDVDLLKSVVEYEGYSKDDAVIGYFWDTLREVTSEDRRAFLRYVWARCRLPLRASDFDAAFKIQKDVINIGERADQALPSASTCFFSLTLPEYSSVEILKAKLMFAIHNVTTMETDFQTNSAEIAEGYRAL